MDEEDIELWRRMTGDVEKLPGQEYKKPQAIENKIKKEVQERVVIKKPTDRSVMQAQLGSDSLDRRTAERLKRGQMEIEARLDLHGMTQEEAKRALEYFISSCYKGKKRCVLVITGKGGRFKKDQPSGILRQRVPEWLGEGETRRVVLRFVPARPRDGGGGALYVLLRRQRD